MNLPLEIALAGTAFYLLAFAALLRYAALHYTRTPGGEWTTFEKSLQVSEPVEERRAA